MQHSAKTDPSLLPTVSLCLAMVWVVNTPWLLAQLLSVLRLVAALSAKKRGRQVVLTFSMQAR